MRRILIIGGGIAGLSAGIFAQKNGFSSILLERHLITGGECTGWDRQGYHIDNCIHWMVGTLPGTETYQLWEELGALGPDIPLVEHDAFLRFDSLDGRQFHIWNDLERMREEMTALSPVDAKKIAKFVEDVRNYTVIESVTTKPKEERSWAEIVAYYWKIRKAILPHIRHAKKSLLELSQHFEDKFIGNTMLAYMPETFYAEALLYMYAVATSGKAGIPVGGSRAMTRRMQDKYEALGGEVRCHAEVEEILIDHDTVKGVVLKDGTAIEADVVVAACDPHVTLHHLLHDRYKDKYFERRWKDNERYPLFSHACVYFGSKTKLKDDESDSIAFLTRKPFIMAGREQRILLVKSFQYEPRFAPEGGTILQIMIQQNEADYEYFEQLRTSDLKAYQEEKRQIGDFIRQELEAHFPELEGQLQMVEFTTSYSLTRYCRAYKGSYMPFVTKPRISRDFHDGRIKGLKNLYLAGQWLQPPGGLINAAITGKFAILRIMKDNN